jgi:hypothetical protein
MLLFPTFAQQALSIQVVSTASGPAEITRSLNFTPYIDANNANYPTTGANHSEF